MPQRKRTDPLRRPNTGLKLTFIDAADDGYGGVTRFPWYAIHPARGFPMTPEMHKEAPRKRRRPNSLSLTPTQMNRVCRAVRQLWVRYGSQVRVAQELDVSQQTVSGVLARRSATPAFAAVVARATGVPYEELVGPPDSLKSTIAQPHCAALPLAAPSGLHSVSSPPPARREG
jgi:hypothetical protein